MRGGAYIWTVLAINNIIVLVSFFVNEKKYTGIPV
jgi:hypothetical protein